MPALPALDFGMWDCRFRRRKMEYEVHCHMDFRQAVLTKHIFVTVWQYACERKPSRSVTFKSLEALGDLTQNEVGSKNSLRHYQSALISIFVICL